MHWNFSRLISGVLLLIMLFVSLPRSAENANILGVFTSHSPSHLIVHMSAMKALAEQGHNITVVSSFKPKIMHKNINSIVVPLTAEEEIKLENSLSSMVNEKHSMISTLFKFFGQLSMMIDKQYDVVDDKRVRALYEQPNDSKFDLVFFGFFMNTYQMGLAAKLKCPLIVIWTGQPMEIVNNFVGNPSELSYVPGLNIAVKGGEVMSFSQRLQNFMVTQSWRVFAKIIDNKMLHFYDRLFAADKEMPSYAEAQKNVSLVFTNSHAHSEGPIRPNVPALIEIGGIQIKDKPDPLPKDIAEFLNDAEHGAILFSLGSNLKGSHISTEIVEALYKAFASLKQKVIWKWEDLNKTPGNSPNILYKKWLPQDDILAHPKIKLFITHAGKGGIAEAQYHGVPMLAMPVFADQPGNADNIVKSGYGLRLDLLTLNSAELKAAINELLENPAYAENIKAFSKLYRDRPLTAKQSVVYWTEYILRHHGAPHLQSPAVHMNFIEYNNLDIYALLVSVLVGIYLIIKFAIKFIYNKLTKSKKTQKSSKNKKLKTK